MLITPLNKRKLFGVVNNNSITIDSNNLLVLLTELNKNCIKKFYLIEEKIYYENINDLNFFLNYKVI